MKSSSSKDPNNYRYNQKNKWSTETVKGSTSKTTTGNYDEAQYAFPPTRNPPSRNLTWCLILPAQSYHTSWHHRIACLQQKRNINIYIYIYIYYTLWHDPITLKQGIACYRLYSDIRIIQFINHPSWHVINTFIEDFLISFLFFSDHWAIHRNKLLHEFQ